MTLVSPVISAVEGDGVTVDGYRRNVGPRCDCDRVGFFCLSCRQLLANFYQAELHVDDGRQHVVARACATHGMGAL